MLLIKTHKVQILSKITKRIRSYFKKEISHVNFTWNFTLILQGRHGLGNIYVWASGDGGEDDDCNCDGYAASMWTVSINSAINDGQNAHYDESCSSTLASTFSNGAKDPNTGVVSHAYTCASLYHYFIFFVTLYMCVYLALEFFRGHRFDMSYSLNERKTKKKGFQAKIAFECWLFEYCS